MQPWPRLVTLRSSTVEQGDGEAGWRLQPHVGIVVAGGAVYDQVHANPAYLAAAKKHPEVERLMKNEVYNRYVEVISAAANAFDS